MEKNDGREALDASSDNTGEDMRGSLSESDIAPARGMLEDAARSARGKATGPRKSRLKAVALWGTPVFVMFVALFALWMTLTQSVGVSGSGAGAVDGTQSEDTVTRKIEHNSIPRVNIDPHLNELVESEGGDAGADMLDRTTLMLDEMHYNIADLEAKGRSVDWSSKDDGVVRIDSVKSEGGVSRCHLVAVRQGLTEVTARSRGRTGTCTVRVISGSSQQRPGDVPFQYDAQIAGQMFYMQDGTWGDSFVEAYVNNIEKIVKEYQYMSPFKEEATEKKLWCYRHTGAEVKFDEKNKKITSLGGTGIVDVDASSGGPFPYADSRFKLEKVLTKKKGAIDANGWLFLVTTKNEWGYLLHREENGWKVIASKALATGYNREKFEQYLAVQVQRPEGVNYTYERWGQYDGIYQNNAHKDVGSTQGRPASAGCIRVGYLEDELMYYLYHDADLGTRLILF